MAKAMVTIKIGDLPEIQKKLEDAAETITDLKRQLAEAREIVEELYLLATSQKTIEEQADAITNARNFLEGKKGEQDA